MQDIKGFTLTMKAPQRAAGMVSATGEVPLFLTSADGQDWYECQAAFADDTIKIMYDADGVIRGMVDKPVAQRGHTLAVSMFFPLGMSVAELQNVPAGCAGDGRWRFVEGQVVRNTAWFVRRAEKQKQRRLSQVATEMAPLQAAMLLGDITEAESQRLKVLLAYARTLSALDVTTDPEAPLPALP